MGVVSYLFADYIKDIASVSVDIIDGGGSAVDANYPIANMRNEKVSLRTWTDAKVAIKLQITFPFAYALQTFFIGNHNFSGGTFDINSYTANDFTTDKIIVEDDLPIRLLDQYHYESEPPLNREYWELDFSATTTTDSVFKIGRLMCYDATSLIQLTDIPDVQTARGYGFKNIINLTSYGVRSATHKLTEKRERFQLLWNQRLASNNIDAELRTLYETVYGDAHPFVYIPSIDDTECYYVNIEQSELLYTEIFGKGANAHVGNVTLRLIEAVRGKI